MTQFVCLLLFQLMTKEVHNFLLFSGLILARGNRMKKGRLRRFPQVLPAETGTHLLVWVELDECRVNSTATFSSEH